MTLKFPRSVSIDTELFVDEGRIGDQRFIYRAITTGVLHVIENSNDARLKGNLPHVYAVKRTLEYLLSFAILLTAWILLIEDTPLKKLDRSNDWGFWNMVNLVRNVDALDETLWLLPHRRSTHPNLNTWDDKAISVSEEIIKKVSKSESREISLEDLSYCMPKAIADQGAVKRIGATQGKFGTD
ncbi:hypothetical protein RHSIM_Rhsim05G0026400 [Rhododendron simsii]|uniref:Uncharacterized protein n=1 Tax=Rhododendron simsii TaxID=118357 RepID=A0A834LNP3_RHOSS|nr:hypothetical protein RHSIM_Rhsim05G0026400 [Rhododendron simsii]